MKRGGSVEENNLGGKNNLVPFTSDTAKENGRRGGKKSAETRRKYATMMSLAKKILGSPAPEHIIDKLRDELPEIELEDDEVTVGALMLLKQVSKAMVDGDSKAFELVRDTAGEKPADKIEPVGKTNVSDDFDKIKEVRDILGARTRRKE